MISRCKILSTFTVLIATMHLCNSTKELEKQLTKLVSSREILNFITEGGSEICDVRMLEKNPRLIVDVNKPCQKSHEILTHLICTDSNERLKSLLKKFRKSNLWHKSRSPRSKYVLISNTTNLEELSKIFWNFKIYNVALLQKISNSKQPTKLSDYSKIHQRSVSYDTYVVIKDVVKIPKPNKIILQMDNPHNTNLELYFKSYLNIMYESVKIVGHHLNMEVSYSKKCSVNTDEYICLIIGERSAKHENTLYDGSETFSFDIFHWMVPRIREDRGHQSMIFVFSWPVAITLLVIFTLLVCIFWAPSKILQERLALRQPTRWVVITIQFLLGYSTSATPKSPSLRILVIFTLFFGFHISNVYQSHMTDVLTESPYKEEIKNIQELVESKIPLLVIPSHLRRLKNREFANYKELKDQLLVININPEQRRFDYCVKNNCALMSSKNYLQHFLPQYAFKFYPLEYGVVKTANRNFYMRKGHYFLNTLNRFQKLIQEVGIFQRILSDLKRKWKIHVKSTGDPEENIYLQFRHLKVVFLLWLFGLGTATVVFIGELLYYHCYDKKKSQESVTRHFASEFCQRIRAYVRGVTDKIRMVELPKTEDQINI